MSSGAIGTAARLAGGAELSPPGRLAMYETTLRLHYVYGRNAEGEYGRPRCCCKGKRQSRWTQPSPEWDVSVWLAQNTSCV